MLYTRLCIASVMMLWTANNRVPNSKWLFFFFFCKSAFIVPHEQFQGWLRPHVVIQTPGLSVFLSALLPSHVGFVPGYPAVVNHNCSCLPNSTREDSSSLCVSFYGGGKPFPETPEDLVTQGVVHRPAASCGSHPGLPNLSQHLTRCPVIPEHTPAWAASP